MVIQVMEMDLTENQAFHFQVVNNFWSRGVLLHILIIRKKNILIQRKGPTQGLEHTLTAEKMY